MAHLFRHGSRDELQQDMDVFGAPPPDLIQQINEADTFEVWPENEEPIALFLRLQTQWRVGPTGSPIGLDYAGVRAAMAMMRRPMTPELFQDLQLMEGEALRIFREADA